jgi:hypothetical protein
MRTMGFDKIADALGHQTRRNILLELVDDNPLQPLEALATHDPREDEKLQLIHIHLPKLDDMGYVTWDREDETVVKGSNWEEIEPVVRLLSDNSERIPSDTF